MAKLRASMSVKEFDDNYFYAEELKAFARQLGIAVGRRRKLELETLIRDFLRTGVVPPAKPMPDRRSGEVRDRLATETVVRAYVDDRRTKTFLRNLVRARAPSLRDKSGQWYWLNEWRRTQLQAGRRITYADLGNRLLELMRSEGRLPRIPAARFNNFVTDFKADPANKGKSRADAVAAWKCIKSVPGPKTYEAYAALESGRRKVAGSE
ncbi:MAG: hypothetical protein F4Y00_04445 [Bacteroidetes bacterium SB0662_bin_6]|nr:hypothetical protein [Bacteroidetes bacterium SB0662_bin_6]